MSPRGVQEGQEVDPVQPPVPSAARHVRMSAVVAVAEVLNQFRYGFAEGGVPEYAQAFSEALADLVAKHWQEGP